MSSNRPWCFQLESHSCDTVNSSQMLLSALATEWCFESPSCSCVDSFGHSMYTQWCCSFQLHSVVLLAAVKESQRHLQLHTRQWCCRLRLSSDVASILHSVVCAALVTKRCFQPPSHRVVIGSPHSVILLAHLAHPTAVLTSSITRLWCFHHPSHIGIVRSTLKDGVARSKHTHGSIPMSSHIVVLSNCLVT